MPKDCLPNSSRERKTFPKNQPCKKQPHTPLSAAFLLLVSGYFLLRFLRSVASAQSQLSRQTSPDKTPAAARKHRAGTEAVGNRSAAV